MTTVPAARHVLHHRLQPVPFYRPKGSCLLRGTHREVPEVFLFFFRQPWGILLLSSAGDRPESTTLHVSALIMNGLKSSHVFRIRAHKREIHAGAAGIRCQWTADRRELTFGGWIVEYQSWGRVTDPERRGQLPACARLIG